MNSPGESALAQSSPRARAGEGTGTARLVLASSSILLFATLLIASRIATGPVVQADEGSYLLNAAAIAGKLARSALIIDYRSGYSLLLAPAFLLASNFQAAYGIVLATNALLIASIPFALYRIVGTAFGEIPARERALFAATATLYAPMLVLSQYALSDNALVTAYAWSLALGATALRNGGWRHALACGALLGFLFVIHTRGAPLAAPVLLAFALHALVRPVMRARVVLIWIGACSAAALHRPIEWMAGKFTDFRAGAPSLEGVLGHFTQAVAWRQALLNAGGATLAAVVGSAGLVIVLALWVIRRFRAGHRFGDPAFVLAVAGLASLLACIATTAVFFTPPARADHVAYGRYLISAMPVVVMLGLCVMRSPGFATTSNLLVALGAGLLLTLLVCAGFHAWPAQEPGNWYPINTVELFVPYKFAGRPFDVAWISCWLIVVVLCVIVPARAARPLCALTLAAVNVTVGAYMFMDNTVFSRNYYAKGRTVLAAVRAFRATTGSDLCVRVDSSLSHWHRVDFPARLYDQLPESVHAPGCIPATIAPMDPAQASLGAPHGTIALAAEWTSPTGNFPVALFARDEPATRAFLQQRPLAPERWLTVPAEQRRAALRASAGTPPTVRVESGVTATVDVMATNLSDTTWYPDALHPVRVGVRLQGEDAHVVREQRVEFPGDVPPGQSRTLAVPIGRIQAPGRYVLVVGVVQEGVAWFPDPLQIPLDVAP